MPPFFLQSVPMFQPWGSLHCYTTVSYCHVCSSVELSQQMTGPEDCRLFSFLLTFSVNFFLIPCFLLFWVFFLNSFWWLLLALKGGGGCSSFNSDFTWVRSRACDFPPSCFFGLWCWGWGEIDLFEIFCPFSSSAFLLHKAESVKSVFFFLSATVLIGC